MSLRAGGKVDAEWRKVFLEFPERIAWRNGEALFAPKN
jgi:hypothetical protein